MGRWKLAAQACWASLGHSKYAARARFGFAGARQFIARGRLGPAGTLHSAARALFGLAGALELGARGRFGFLGALESAFRACSVPPGRLNWLPDPTRPRSARIARCSSPLSFAGALELAARSCLGSLGWIEPNRTGQASLKTADACCTQHRVEHIPCMVCRVTHA